VTWYHGITNNGEKQNMKALASDNWIDMQSLEYLPDGVKVITVSCGDYTEYKRLPSVISHDGKYYGLSGWNSDYLNAYYRTDRMNNWVRLVKDAQSDR
jgi:hypothetical protein